MCPQIDYLFLTEVILVNLIFLGTIFRVFLVKLFMLFPYYFLKDFIYLVSERGKEWERNISVWLPLT